MSKKRRDKMFIPDSPKARNGRKILVVDDDRLVTDLLMRLLVFEGYDIVAENDSDKSVEVALRELPDLICLDLMMSAPDGFRISRMLRDIPDFNNTPILIISALDDDDDARAVAFGAGANDYLTKPFHPDEIFETIEKLLHGKELGLYEKN